jgi:hypothetical protein
MGSAIDAWIEYDDDARYHPERAAEPPFSQVHDNCIPLEYFTRFRSSGDYQFWGAIAGLHRETNGPSPLFPLRGGLPPNVSGYTKSHVLQIVDENDPSLS